MHCTNTSLAHCMYPPRQESLKLPPQKRRRNLSSETYSSQTTSPYRKKTIFLPKKIPKFWTASLSNPNVTLSNLFSQAFQTSSSRRSSECNFLSRPWKRIVQDLRCSAGYRYVSKGLPRFYRRPCSISGGAIRVIGFPNQRSWWPGTASRHW